MRYKITLEYDGSRYNGWQRQGEGVPSVQEALQRAIYKISGQYVHVAAAGRTDAGVHALAQVATFDVDKELRDRNMTLGLNFHLLDEQITVIRSERVADDFHARFSAVRRHYIYRVVNRPARISVDFERVHHVPVPLDIEAMREAAKYLIGEHDFTSFRSTECQAKSPVKTLDVLDIEVLEYPEMAVGLGKEIRFCLNARSFLHNQVRITVGTLLKVGHGRIKPEAMPAILDARERASAGPTAPPYGLYLARVDY